ncbi:MAG: hypothetical protein IJU79_00185 [Desulfovibrionaceae bacterium]|nr:hypothetical protein [Desulfovibrionaceae bacterium]
MRTALILVPPGYIAFAGKFINAVCLFSLLSFIATQGLPIVDAANYALYGYTDKPCLLFKKLTVKVIVLG